MKRLSFALVAVVSIASFVGSPRPARAQAVPPAGGPGPVTSEDDPAAHFERGVSFFQSGDYVAAMIEFERAYKLDPRPQVLYNIGQTAREQRDYARALKSFERYLAESTDVKEERRKQVEGYVAELKGKVSRLEVVVDVQGAEVTVDDLLVGRTPLAEPLVVNAGRRKVEVKKTGYATITRQVEIAGTASEKLDFALEPLTSPTPSPAPAPPPVTTVPPAGEPASAPVGRWVALGITGALGIGTAVVGAIALGKGSDFSDALAEVPTNRDTIDDARTEARTFAITADVLGAATLAAGVTTIILFVVEGSSGGAEKAAVRPVVGPGFVGVDGRF